MAKKMGRPKKYGQNLSERQRILITPNMKEGLHYLGELWKCKGSADVWRRLLTVAIEHPEYFENTENTMEFEPEHHEVTS